MFYEFNLEKHDVQVEIKYQQISTSKKYTASTWAKFNPLSKSTSESLPNDIFQIMLKLPENKSVIPTQKEYTFGKDFQSSRDMTVSESAVSLDSCLYIEPLQVKGKSRQPITFWPTFIEFYLYKKGDKKPLCTINQDMTKYPLDQAFNEKLIF